MKDNKDDKEKERQKGNHKILIGLKKEIKEEKGKKVKNVYILNKKK